MPGEVNTDPLQTMSERIRAFTMTYLPSGSVALSRRVKSSDLLTKTLTPRAKLE